MRLAAVLAFWAWAPVVFLYCRALRNSPRHWLVLCLGALTWPVSIPLELACKAFEYLVRRFLEKVLP